MSDLGGGINFEVTADLGNVGAGADAIQREVDKAGAAVGAFGKKASSVSASIQKQNAATAKSFAQIGKSTGASGTAQLNAQTKIALAGQRQLLQAQRVAGAQAVIQTRAQAAAQVAAARGAASQQNAVVQAQAQQGVIAARRAAQTRVAITRGAVDSIVGIEKGLGRVIEGTAKTAVGATKRLFSGIVGSVQRSFAERRSTIIHSFEGEAGLFRSAAAQQQIISARANKGITGSLFRTAGVFGGGFFLVNQLKSAFTLGSSFAQGLNVLQAQLGLTAAQMKGVNKLAIDLGNDIKLPGVSALDAAQAIGLLAKQFASLGTGALPAAEAAAKGALELSRAVGATGEEAAGAIGAAVNVFGVQASKATDVADVLASALSKSAGISFQNFRDSFTQAAPAFAAFEKPVEGARGAIVDFSTALATLAKGGLFGENAGAGLKQFLIQGTKLTKQGSAEMLKLVGRAKETGTAFFTAGGKARPFAQTIDILQRGLVGLNQAQRNAALGAIFGARSVNIANVLLSQSTANYLKLQQAIGSSTNAAEKFAAAQNKGVKGALDAIGSELDTIKIQFFEAVNKPLGNAGLAVADFVGKVLSGGGAFATLRKGLLGVAAGLAAVAAAKIGVEVLGLLGDVLPLLFTPFGALAVVAAGLGAAFAIASKGSKSFGDTLRGMAKLAQTVGGFIQKELVVGFQKLGDVLDPIIKRFAPGLDRIGIIIQAFISLATGPAGLGAAFRNLGQDLQFLGRDIGKSLSNSLARLEQRFPFLTKIISGISVVIGPAIVAVRRLASAFSDLLHGDFSVAGQKLLDLGKSIGGGLVNAIASIDFGAVAHALGSKLGRALTGGGIGAAAGFALGGPLGAAIGAALGASVGLAIPRIRDAIASIDVGALFGKFLNGVRLVARQIAIILFDRRTLLAAAGIAAAAAALAIQFAQGFISGLIHQIPDIASAFSTIFKKIFTLPSIVQSALALVIALKTIFSRLPGLLGPTANQVGQQVGQQVATGVSQGVQKGQFAQFATTLVGKLKAAGQTLKAGAITVGQDVGAAIAVGIGAALAGSALGTAKGGLEKGLAFGGIAASAASAFTAGTALSGGQVEIGAAAAAASVGVSLLTAAFTANAKKAAVNKQAVDDLKKSIEAGQLINGKDPVSAFVTQGLEDLPTKVKAVLGKNNFDVAGFIKAEQQGGDAGDKFIRGFGKALDASGQGGVIDSVVKGLFEIDTNASKAFAGASADASLFEGKLQGASGSADELAKKVRDAAAAARTADFGKAIDAFNAKADELKTKADVARAAVAKLLGLQAAPKTGEQATNQTVLGLEGIGGQISAGLAKGIKTATGSAEVKQGLQDFRDQITTIITAPGATAQTIASQLGTVKKAIGEQFGFSTTTAQLQGEVDRVLGGIKTKPVQAELNVATTAESQASAVAAAAALTAQVQANFPAVDAKAAADIASAVAAGSDVSALVSGQYVPVSATMTPDTGSATDAGIAIASAASTAASNNSDLSSVGANAASSFAGGLLSQISVVAQAAGQVAQQAYDSARGFLIIGSPSKLFIKIGQDTMEGFAIGLKDGSTDVIQTAQDIAQAVVDLSLSATQRLAASQTAGRGTVFDALFGNDPRATANKAFEQARASITTNFNTLRGQVQQNGVAVLQAAQTKPGERTIADQLALASKPASLSLTDQFGIANRGAIAQAVDAVEEFGKALLAQGDSVADVAKQLAGYRDILIATASAAGLSKVGAAQLVDSLGLSQAKLLQFVTLARQAGIEINTGAGTKKAVTPPPAPLKVGANPVRQVFFNEGAVQVNVPDSGEAGGLVLANAIAQKIRF